MVRTILLLGIPIVLLATSATASNIVLNGGFTSGTITDWTTNACSVCKGPPWDVAPLPANQTGMLPPDTKFAAATGCDRGPCNDPTSGDWIEQSLATIPTESYTLTFFYDPGGKATAGKTANELEVLWGGSLLTGGEILNVAAGTWEEYQFTVTAPTASTVLEFTGKDSPGKRLHLTDISVDLITPEPPSLLLMGGGLLGMGTLLLRRRKA